MPMNKLPRDKRIQIHQPLGRRYEPSRRDAGYGREHQHRDETSDRRGQGVRRIPKLHLPQPYVPSDRGFDEIWAFCYAKQKNVPSAKAAPEGAGIFGRGLRSTRIRS